MAIEFEGDEGNQGGGNGAKSGGKIKKSAATKVMDEMEDDDEMIDEY